MRRAPLIALFMLMGLSYYLIEIVWRGYSHYSMFFLGGVVGILVGMLNEYSLSWNTPIELQIIYGLLVVLPAEFITGVLLHFILQVSPPVWDYSELPLNVLGQVSLCFAPLFSVPILLAILVDDYYRFLFMGGRKPKYVSAIVTLVKSIVVRKD